MKPDSQLCPKCGGTMSWGVVRRGPARPGAGGGGLQFVLPGAPTSSNPIQAFRQGLAGEVDDVVYDFAGLTGRRCSACGFLEFYLPGEPS
ncbi:hypothetical protein [Paludisphaera mucosa]|uniref:Uncharacterized protein n=1 Tax=Paludisphaera mucosa TaxID=3030827 RepID=A0ABT6FJD0_9BACT|nr:hypothetical protein [Paludisphaera mucosa]MDG3007604.1 hypothetical protein [Paludisphaera mucosa]